MADAIIILGAISVVVLVVLTAIFNSGLKTII